MRVEKSFKNMIFGVAFQISNVILQFVVRTALLKTLGITQAGITGLFTEIIAVLSVAELGVGTAITYHLYKPLSEQNDYELGRIMNFFKTAYRIIAGLIMGLGLCITPFIHLIVRKTDLSISYIRIVFLIFVFQTAISYLFSYKAILLNADQNMFKVSAIRMVCRIICSVLNIILLILYKNFFIYLLMEILYVISSNIICSVVAERQYPYLKTNKDKLSKEEQKSILKNVKHVFIGTLSGKITSSTDNILISSLDKNGTISVGYYSNYNMIFNAVRNILDQIVYATHGSIGNMMSTESDEKCNQVLNRLTFLVFMLCSVCGCVLYCVATPFVRDFWLGSEFTLPNALVFVVTINFFYMVLREPLYQVVRVAGLFEYDKNISILGSIINLIVSLILGYYIGMTGIFIGTTCTLIIQIVLKIILIYKKRFKISCKNQMIKWLIYTLLFVGEMFLTSYLCDMLHIGSIVLSFVAKLIIATIIPLIFGFLLFSPTDEWHYAVELIKRKGVR